MKQEVTEGFIRQSFTIEKTFERLEQMPRLNFAEDLVPIIQLGTKTATTRLAYEKDPASDLDKLRPGTVCQGTTTGGKSFAKLLITRMDCKNFEDIDDNLARIENCKKAIDLQKLLKRFYPDIGPGSQLWVFHFKLQED